MQTTILWMLVYMLNNGQAEVYNVYSTEAECQAVRGTMLTTSEGAQMGCVGVEYVQWTEMGPRA